MVTVIPFRYLWAVSFDGDTLILRCPWWGFSCSYGGKQHGSMSLLWGFSFHWGRNKYIREGDCLYLKSYEFVFREICFRDALRRNPKYTSPL